MMMMMMMMMMMTMTLELVKICESCQGSVVTQCQQVTGPE